MLTIASLEAGLESQKKHGIQILSRAKTKRNISAIQMRKLRFIEIKKKPKSHSQEEVKIRDLISSPSASKTLVLPST